jgi:hypothetical protein
MSLIARGGSLLVGSDGKLTTNEDCCCGGGTTCCATHKITSISLLSGGSTDSCCDWLTGTYLPDSELSSGCLYRFYEEYPEPSDPCTDPPASLCLEIDFLGTTYRWFPRSLNIEGYLDNDDLFGDKQWAVSVEMSFWVYGEAGPDCLDWIAEQTGGSNGTEDESCSTGVVDFIITSNSASGGHAPAIHPACGTSGTGITIQAVIAPL